MKIYFDEKSLNLVRQILRENGVEKNVFVFGSRARGDQSEYSDLDLLIQEPSALPLARLLLLTTAFADSKLPVTVDLVEWSKISQDFKDKIADELVSLF